MTQEQTLRDLLQADVWFMRLLHAAASLALPDWALAGGVIRDTVWDKLCHRRTRTPVGDVDLVYFDAVDADTVHNAEAERALAEVLGDVRWDVKNEAGIHRWYQTHLGEVIPAFGSLEEAIKFFPETCVAVGVTLVGSADLRVIAPVGLDDLLGLVMRRNSFRTGPDYFARRLEEKRIRQKWPSVSIIDDGE